MAKAPPPLPSTPKAYSYERFSTAVQGKGDSSRRQGAGAAAWAKEKGIEFDEQMQDHGQSGYHGANRKQGALGAFCNGSKRVTYQRAAT